MKNIKEAFELFACDLTSFSPEQIEEPIKIILPHNLYRQIAENLSEASLISHISLNNSTKLYTKSGVTLLIRSKEGEEKKLSSRLHNLFKDITND
jgi:hypothetical protein